MSDLPERHARRTMELLEGKRRLEQEVGDLASFSNNIAHDLNAPLRAIRGYVTILLEDHRPSLSVDGIDSLVRIEANAERMARMIDGLLDFSRLAHADAAETDVDTQIMVHSVTQELQNLPDGRKSEFLIDSLPPMRGDATMLRRVWSNLLSNAVKFSSRNAEPRIRISAACQDNEIVFSVQDNGVGFDMAYVDQLFGVFNRLHAAGEFPGLGLGLAIVRRIAFRHGGRAWARGALGGGATFFFSLPLPQ